MSKHIWNLDEEIQCCYIYLNCAIDSCRPKRIESREEKLVYTVSTILSHIPSEEITEELRRIKGVCNDIKFFDRIKLEPLCDYTVQTKRALAQAIERQLSVFDEIDPRPLAWIRRHGITLECYPVFADLGEEIEWRPTPHEEGLGMGENGYILLSDDTSAFQMWDNMDPAELAEILEDCRRSLKPRNPEWEKRYIERIEKLKKKRRERKNNPKP